MERERYCVGRGRRQSEMREEEEEGGVKLK